MRKQWPSYVAQYIRDPPIFSPHSSYVLTSWEKKVLGKGLVSHHRGYNGCKNSALTSKKVSLFWSQV